MKWAPSKRSERLAILTFVSASSMGFFGAMISYPWNVGLAVVILILTYYLTPRIGGH